MLVLCFYAPLSAQVVWDNDSGDGLWSTAANWSSDVVPGAGDDVVFDGAVSNGNCVIDVAASVNSLTIGFAGLITLNQDVAVAEDMSVNAVNILFGQFNYNVSGDIITADDNFQHPDGSTISLVGSADQTIFGDGALHNLNINKPSGEVLLPENITLWGGTLSGMGNVRSNGGRFVMDRFNQLYTLDFTGSLDELEFANNFRQVTLRQDLTINKDLHIIELGVLLGEFSYLIDGDVYTFDDDFYHPDGSTISLVGTGDQTLSGNGNIHYLDYAKPSGNVLSPDFP